jgi:phosphoserine phosphatase
VAALAGRIADVGGNIDRIVRVAAYPVTAVELEVSGVATETLRVVLAREASAQRVDLAVQRSGLARRAKRLVVMDVDSTLVQGEVIEMLADRAGCGREVAR